ncbi:MAG: hypothetical protein JO115_13895 [Pseudonocardiales bacterium]|nr:hypothetical protein [Pseudonocardiales bacterium]
MQTGDLLTADEAAPRSVPVRGRPETVLGLRCCGWGSGGEPGGLSFLPATAPVIGEDPSEYHY